MRRNVAHKIQTDGALATPTLINLLQSSRSYATFERVVFFVKVRARWRASSSGSSRPP